MRQPRRLESPLFWRRAVHVILCIHMISTRWLAIILLILLTGMLAALLAVEGDVSVLPRLLERAGIAIPPDVSVPDLPLISVPSAVPTNGLLPGGSESGFDLTSGASRFSQGKCTVDADCFVGGCSAEVCGSKPDAITTCEFSSNFPNTTTHQCGCLQKVCAWSKKK